MCYQLQALYMKRHSGWCSHSLVHCCSYPKCAIAQARVCAAQHDVVALRRVNAHMAASSKIHNQAKREKNTQGLGL